VWLIDECHALTADAQGAFLKLLEEPPGHVYFMLATTDPQKLKATIRTRCTEIKVRELTLKETEGLVRRIYEERCGSDMHDLVAEKLAEVACGSARKALVLLQQIIGLDNDETKLETLQKADAQVAAIEIARAIMARKGWKTVAALLRDCNEDPESIRWMMLSYFSKVALSGGHGAAEAVAVMEEFQDNYYDSKKAGLVLSCYRACKG
jgi:DNA polymerase III gamma/tau subunit